MADSISIVLLIELEEINGKSNKKCLNMMKYEKCIERHLNKLLPFLNNSKFKVKNGCECYFCVQMGYKDLKSTCDILMSDLRILTFEIMCYEKKMQLNKNEDKIFLNRLIMNLKKMIALTNFLYQHAFYFPRF